MGLFQSRDCTGVEARPPPAYDPPLFNHDIEEYVAQSLREAAEKKDPHIAVIGERGVGKSSLINSLRGIRPNDVNAAQVGADEVVTEEQMTTGAFYSDAGLIYQDVPGCRGNELALGMGQEYIDKFKLNEADCCLFVYTSVINVDAIECARLLREAGVTVCFVRNKVDVDCSNEIEDNGAASAEVALDKIRERACSQLSSKEASEFAVPGHLFLLSAKYAHAVQHSPPRFDFERLRQTLHCSIKDTAKRSQVKEIFAKNAAALAARRAEECYSYVCDYTAASAASGAIPVPGVSQVGDVAILMRACEEFQRIFCLSEAQLTVPGMAGFGTYLALKISTSLPCVFGVAQIANWAADGTAWLPMLGIPLSMLLGASVSAIGMWLTLSAIISRLEKISADAYEVVMHSRSHDEAGVQAMLKRRVDELFPEQETEASLEGSLDGVSAGMLRRRNVELAQVAE